MRSTPPAAAHLATRPRLLTVLALAAILLIAAGLRLAGLDRQPWGVHADELGPSLAGLDVLHGQRPFALVDYDIWLHAATFWVLGVSPLAVRLLPALGGSLLPVGVFLALRSPYGRRVALLAAAFAAIAIWPLALSRSGFSISYLPVVLSLFLWQLHAAWQTGRARRWVTAGALLAIAQYVYFPSRAVLLVLGISAIYVLVFGPRERLRSAWPLLPVFLVGVIPLYWHTPQLDAETTRYTTVFILAPENLAGSPLVALAQQAWLGLSMFFYHGDLNFRHNVPPRPVFDLVVLLPALLGVGLLLRSWQQPKTLFWFLWMGCLLGPMLLSTESPHFLRAAGILPLTFVPPALGLDQIGRLAERRGWRPVGLALIAATLACSLGNTVYAYFGPAYRDDPALYYAFAGQDLDLAVDINRFLDAGWQGAGWLARDTTPQPGRVVWIDRQLWSDPDRQRALRLLVPLPIDATPAFEFIQTAFQAGPATAPEVSDMGLIVVPGHEQPAVTLLPLNRLIRVKDGPLPSWAPPGVKPIYRLYTTESPAGLPAQPMACFSEGIELLRAAVTTKSASVHVDLRWRARTRPSLDYTVFVHVVAQDAIAGQVDTYPVAGRYPTSWWRPGDVIADAYTVPVPPGTDLTDAYLRVGLYRWDTLINLPATDCAGNALGNFAIVPLKGAP